MKTLRIALTLGLGLLLAAPLAHAQNRNKDKPGLVGKPAYRAVTYTNKAMLDFLADPENVDKAGKAASDYYEAISPTLERSISDTMSLVSSQLGEEAPELASSVTKAVLEASAPAIEEAMGKGLELVFDPANQAKTVDFVGQIGDKVVSQMGASAPKIAADVTAAIGAQLSADAKAQLPGLIRAATASLTAEINETVLPSMADSMKYITPMLEEGTTAVTKTIITTIADNRDEVKLIGRAGTDAVLEGTAHALWATPETTPDGVTAREAGLGVLGKAMSETIAHTVKESHATFGQTLKDAGAVALTAMLPVALFGIFLLSALRLRNDHEKKMRDEDQDLIELKRRLKQAEARASEAEATLERNNVLGVALQTLSDMESRAPDAAAKAKIAELYAGLVSRLPAYLKDPDAEDPRDIIEELRRSFGG